MKELRYLFERHPQDIKEDGSNRYFYGAEQFFVDEETVEEGDVVRVLNTEGGLIEIAKRFGSRECSGKRLPTYFGNMFTYVELESGR